MEVRIAAATLDLERGVWVVVECPYCGRRNRHQHGAGGDDGDPRKSLGNRTVDCGGLIGTYDLVEHAGPTAHKVSDFASRPAIRAAAKESGLTIRAWEREYAGRTEPLTEVEMRARGDLLDQASGW